MRILITNDDGYQAEGIQVLASVLRLYHDVWVLAPDKERSGVSSAITITQLRVVKEISTQFFSCSGTPADCVILACFSNIMPTPDVILSGINKGPNLGCDIINSGTCGAARQAALNNIPGIAISSAMHSSHFNYNLAANFVADNIAGLIAHWNKDTYININIPGETKADYKAVWTYPCQRKYIEEYNSFFGPDGYNYCFIKEKYIEYTPEPGSDFDTIQEGNIALSSLMVHPQFSKFFPLGSTLHQ